LKGASAGPREKQRVAETGVATGRAA